MVVFMGVDGIYPLVMTNLAMENPREMVLLNGLNGKTHYNSDLHMINQVSAISSKRYPFIYPNHQVAT